MADPQQEADLTKERIERCAPVARKILKLIADFPNLEMGQTPKEQMVAIYEPLQKQILEALLEANLPVGWIGFCKQLALQPFDFSLGLATESINNSLDRLQVRIFGKMVAEMSMSEVDAALKGGELMIANPEAPASA